jgi:hypothetical protein
MLRRAKRDTERKAEKLKEAAENSYTSTEKSPDTNA